MTTTTQMQTATVGENEIAYRELGEGPAVLLMHGWPTSSYLWREVVPAIAERNRVIAPDLPGFGASSKPLGVRYGFELFEGSIDGLLAALEIDEVAIAGHDLGGPIAVHWALRNRSRVSAIALLNTLVYPEFSDAVLEFVRAASDPSGREQLTSPEGLEAAIKLGLADEDRIGDEVIAAVRDPFTTADARRALADAGIGLELEGFAEIARDISGLDVPVRIVYGEQDRILPDIAETVARLAADLPQAVVTSLPGAGHFLQEEAPAEVGALLADFFADPDRRLI